MPKAVKREERPSRWKARWRRRGSQPALNLRKPATMTPPLVEIPQQDAEIATGRAGIEQMRQDDFDLTPTLGEA